MADQPVNGRVRDDPAESSESDSAGSRSGAVRSYSLWVSLYAGLHRRLRHRTVVFGGSGVVGALVLVRQFYAFASEPAEWSGLPSWTVVTGIVLFGFGVGYYVIRDDTACSECGTPFSKRRIGKRPVSKPSGDDGRERTYLEETYECESCGEATTELCSQSEWSYARH